MQIVYLETKATVFIRADDLDQELVFVFVCYIFDITKQSVLKDANWINCSLSKQITFFHQMV